MMVANSVRRLSSRIEQFEAAQRQLSTGRRIFAASDDVPGMDRALRLRNDLAVQRQELRNAEDGTTWAELGDSRLGSLTAELQRARELAVLGASSTTNTAEREAMAQEVDGILASAIDAANARSQGRPLFSGHTGGDAVAKVAGVWTYVGDTGKVTRRVSETDYVTINVTGDETFGFNAGADVFTSLEVLAADLRAGNTTGIGNALTALDGALGRVTSSRSLLGVAGNRLESARFRTQTQQITLTAQLSEIEDTDMAAAIMELQTQEVAYQAAQAALAHALQPSLAAFLR
jgi:flagellar hook-associated protein 3 FlgL